MENYDYKILSYICGFGKDSTEELRMIDIAAKFGTAGRASAVALYRNQMISWESSEDDAFCHDDSGKIKATDKGVLENARHKYNRQLKTAEVWRERIVGYLFGVATPLTVWLVTDFLIPLLQSL